MAKTKGKAAPKTEKKAAARKADKKGLEKIDEKQAAPKTEKKAAARKADKKGLEKIDEKKEPERQVKHVEGIKKTALSSLLGIAGGVASFYLSAYSLFILIVIVYSQRIILPRVGVEVKEYRATDWFFLIFMTVAFWFVSWTILLNPA